MKMRMRVDMHKYGHMRRREGTLAALLMSLCMLSGCVTGCGLLPQEAELPSAPIAKTVEDAAHTLTPVVRGDVLLTKDIRCQYKPARTEGLSFGVTGEYIRKMYVQAGDTVAEGDLLAELNLGDLPDELSEQSFQLDKLQLKKEQTETNKELDLKEADIRIGQAADYTTRKELTEAKTTTETHYDEQLKSLDDAIYIQEMRIREIQNQIESRRIYASMDGSITYARTFSDGDTSNEMERVFTISDVASSVFLVTGADAEYFSIGEEVMINYGSEDHEGLVADPESLGLSANAGTAYIALVVPDPSIEEGTRGLITLVLDERKDVLCVKSGAIKKVGDQTVVYVLDAEGMKSMKEVTTGLDNGEMVEILDGLQEGEEIIDE